MAGPKFLAEFRGVPRLLRKLGRTKGDLLRATEGALFEEAEETMTEAKRLTPVDEGVLRSSGHVQLPRVEGSRVSVELGFGGPAGSGDGQTKDVGYAVFVHENLTARHPVGQAKYLETPVNRRKPTFGRRLGARIRRRLGLR